MARDALPFDTAAMDGETASAARPPARRDRARMRLFSGRKASMDAALFAPARVPLSTDGLRLLTRWLDRSCAVFMALAMAAWAARPDALLQSPLALSLPFLALALLAVIGLETAAAYNNVKARSLGDHLGRIAAVLSAALLPGAWVGATASSRPELVFLLAGGLVLALTTLHAHYKVLLNRMTRSGSLSETVVIVGATENAQRLIERNAESHELQIVGVFDDRLERAPARLGGVPVLGRVDDLLAWDQLPRIDRIIVTVTSDARARVRTLIDRLRWLPNKVVLLLDLDGFNPETESLAQIADTPAAYVSGAPQDARKAVVKRVCDLVMATGLLVALSPVLIACAVAVKATSPGPVFFRQRRHGFNNQLIRVWKFRTMRHDPGAAERMRAQTRPDDARVTQVGAFLRRTSLDELPQLINVIRGEMSLVGPRPHALGMTAESTEVHDIVADYAHRHRVKPGITGWAQISGSRGPVRTKAEVLERVRLDLEYINRASFWFDLQILLKTVPVLLGDRETVR